jgi:hypothetical protein
LWKEIIIDNSVLRSEADKFQQAIAACRMKPIENKPTPLSKIFENQAHATDMLLSTLARILQPMEGATIVKVLNVQNQALLENVRHQRDFFDDDPQGKKRRHFLNLVEQEYIHRPKKMFEGGRSERDVAKGILRDFAESTILYFVMRRKKDHGLEIDPAMVGQIVHKAHELIADNPDCVVAFPAGGRRGMGQSPK